MLSFLKSRRLRRMSGAGGVTVFGSFSRKNCATVIGKVMHAGIKGGKEMKDYLETYYAKELAQFMKEGRIG